MSSLANFRLADDLDFGFTASNTVAKIPALIFFIVFPCAGLIGRWQMIFHQGTIVPGNVIQNYKDREPEIPTLAKAS